MSKFKPGQSGNPKGRPKGLRDHRTVFLGALKAASTSEEEFAQSLVEKAIEGNTTAMQVCADRLWKSTKPTLPCVELPHGDTNAKRAELVVKSVTEGKVPADHGAALIATIRGAAELTEIEQIKRRLEMLET